MISALQGAVFAVVILATNVVLDHDAWGRALRGAGVAGAGFAVMMWLLSRRVLRDTRDIVAGIPAGQRGEVVRAAETGTPRADTELRVAAVALARSRLADYEARRTLCVVAFAAFAVMGLIGAIAASPWYLLAAALFATLGVWAVRYQTTLRRRVTALETAS